jgi:hypothetical protein
MKRLAGKAVASFVILALLTVAPQQARAWGDQGHRVICAESICLVQPTTRAEIQKLISTDERFSSFSDACKWPDHPRQRASEHFLNLRRDSDGLHSEARPGESACVVTAIKKDFEVLSSGNASQAQKLRAVGEDVNEAATELMKTITPARIESQDGADLALTPDMPH